MRVGRCGEKKSEKNCKRRKEQEAKEEGDGRAEEEIRRA